MKRFVLWLGFFLVALVSFVVAQECKENDVKSCGYSDEGECVLGVQYCDNGFWSVCVGAKGPVPEVCFNSKDDDCDSFVDEGCACTPGMTRDCGPEKEVGECRFGVESCTEVYEWSGVCMNATLPAVLDLCGVTGEGNGKDDDCDGLVDEDCEKKVVGVPASCFNRVKDGSEEGVDCGGSCEVCNECLNGVLERDEVKVSVDLGSGVVSDCGGLNCPACPTCFDGVLNQGEVEVDCGGPCKACSDPEESDEDGDGLSLKAELMKGTNPRVPDSDFDGVLDGRDASPLCPNRVCDALYGEDSSNCPDDCGGVKRAAIVVLVVIVCVVVGIVLFLYWKYKSATLKSSPRGGRRDDEARGGSSFDARRFEVLSRRKKKEIETKSEKALKESLKE